MFALALHDRFKYPVYRISGSHVYCRFAGPSESYSVDVEGWIRESDRVWEFGCGSVSHLSREQLLELFKRISDVSGLCGEDWFVQPAQKRADQFIEKHIDVFSGLRKVRLSK